MERKLLLCVYFATIVHMSNGCTMEGVTQWLLPQHETIQDTHSGLILNRSTENIEDISRTVFGDSLNRGPYLDVLLQDSMFTISTTDAFAEYEEHETLLSIRVTITFSCTGGSTRPLTFVFNINDTNNHAPVFLPTDNYNFPLALPVPPGFKVTGCEYIIVRDVDLTTKGIDFWMEENPYFEIIYSEQIQPKEFGGIIRTTDLIRSTSEFLTYNISATDVDDTGDPPITTNATINILADNEFRLPDEPIFSAAFYKADYTDDHDLILRENITLREGYDDQVKFNFEGVYAEFFELVADGNQLSFRVKEPLPGDIVEPQIFLVVKAERDFTSGATTTLIIVLAQGVDIIFESPLYEGQIEDNVLRAPNLIITQGFDAIEEIKIVSEYATFFSANRQENTITLSMIPLPTEVIQSNNILNLQILASTNRTSAISVVSLEIIKDDYITPAFEKTIYNGNYNSEIGLSLDPIVLRQGYDDTVVFTLRGEHERYFEKVQQGSVINLNASIPAQIWSEGSLLITVEASKPRTVGANTAVYVTLPAARELSFEAPSYSGSIENNILTLESIVLNIGYAEDVIFELSGQFASHFTQTITQNRITISLQNDLPENVISENNALMLILTASGLNALTTSTNILLDIIKEDTNTPVFDKILYHGSYEPSTGLILQDIMVVQGLDDTVNFALDGVNAELFELTKTGQNISINGSVPPTVWNEGYLFLTLRATKQRTVGANTAIQISLPEAREMSFEIMEYFGIIENNTLTVPEIILIDGYSEDIKFQIISEFENYFTLSNNENKIRIELYEPLPDNVVLENNFIVLTIRASGINAISTSTIVLLEILKEDTITPIFSQDVYTGIYRNSSHMDIENISLVQGYDSAVVFQLDGDHAQYFEFINIANNIKISLKSEIPEVLIFDEKVLLFKILARKERTVGASAIISIQFPRDLTEPTMMKFSKNTYLGTLKDSTFEITDDIILDTGFRIDTQFTLSGEYAEQFSITNAENVVKISLRSSASIEELFNNKFIILQVEARRERAFSVYASLVIDVVTSDVVTFPVFEKAFYSGIYTKDGGLQFEHEIRLLAGFDDTVTFGLEGDSAQWFCLKENGNSVVIVQNTSLEIPQDVIELNHHLLFTIVAYKPGTLGGRSAISVALPKDQTEQVVLRFEESNYIGSIEDGALYLSPLSLNKDTATVQFDITGEYAAYFGITKNQTEIIIELIEDLNIESIENSFIILTIEASHTEAISGHSTVVLEIKEIGYNEATPVFEEAFYLGDYTEENGLQFNHTIRLIQGFDDSVSFSLEGDESQGFIIVHDAPNNIILLRNSKILPQTNNRSQLTFSVVATKPQSIPGRSAIIIFLTELSTTPSLRFSEDYHQGSITNGVLNLGVITLSEGYSEQVKFSLTGDYVDYFQLINEGGDITLRLTDDLPSEIKEKYNILIFALEAELENERTHTTIILEIKPTTDARDTVLNFEETYYTGSYSEINGLIFNSEMTIQDGYSDQLQFNLIGDNSIWFGLERRLDNSVVLTLTGSIPAAVLANNQKLIFVVVAAQPGSIAARATIVIALTDEYTQDSILGFEKISYSGSIINSTLNLEQIVLNEGFTSQVSFALFGDFASFFTFNTDGPKVNINLRGEPIPEDSIPSSRIILLELRASAPQAVPAFATIVLAVKQEDNVSIAEPLSFNQTYYTGRYTAQTGLSFEQLFSLSHGYDDSVVFELQGDSSLWFGLEKRSENLVALNSTSPIPAAVLADNQKLIFVITATRPNSSPATATIIIALPDDVYFSLQPINDPLQGRVSSHYEKDAGFSSPRWPDAWIGELHMALRTIFFEYSKACRFPHDVFLHQYTNDTILGFEQISYIGSIRDSNLTLEPIVLNEGFSPEVSFGLLGDHVSYFGFIVDGPTVRITLREAIPEDSVPTNRIILLELRASAPQAVPALTTIVLAIERENTLPVEQPSFANAYYLGRYTEEDGLSFEQLFSLARGYEESVVFELEGDNSVWFGLVRQSSNFFALTLTSSIPAAVLANNQKLIFIITATRPDSDTARATVVIALPDEYTTESILGFEQITYIGSIRNSNLTLEPITLNEGYNSQVSFSLLGDHMSYFSFIADGPTVRISLRDAIPDDSIPTNRIILLELRASAPQTVPAFTTIVLAVEREETLPAEQLSFAETYYTGRYTEQDDLSFQQLFSLARGYDESVLLTLEGDSSVWFGLETRSANQVALTSISPIPPAVLANNQKLIFIITATRPDSEAARATVVIALPDEYTTDSILGFERISYSGSITNNSLNLEPVVLNQGFTAQVSFTLLGDHASYFLLTVEGSAVKINLRDAIPEDSIPTNRIILLELRASAPQTVPAFTTIVLAVEREETLPAEQLSFAETYYTGRYTEQDGLSFQQLFSLARGYDESVSFALEGDSSAWFGLETRFENQVALTLTSPLPPAVLANNQKLIFIITATRPDSEAARATVVIALPDEYTTDSILGFERISYSGSITNNSLNLEPVVLNQGFTAQVSFTLLGDHASYFLLTVEGSAVKISLRDAIPEDSIPTNRIILLELRASAPQTVPAFTTIVLAVEREETLSAEQLSFAETYYTGRYTEQDGLSFQQLFSLARGYDEIVSFALEGDSSVWFGLETRSANQVALTSTSPIPPAVLANNQKLIFIITATRPDSEAARATVVIALLDEYTTDSILGFERISYSGSITNNSLNLEPVVLNQGFTAQVSFALLGDHASYFLLTVEGSAVKISLRDAIPEDSIPTNRIILLELRASAPQTVPAFSTIVLAVEREETLPAEQLSFAETYYTGRYTEQDGLSFQQLFSLARGYDESVSFALEGDSSVWFGLETRSANQVALTSTSPIPPAVLANNQKLIFIITATRPDSEAARATVVIALLDEYTTDSILGFERISYSGSITNNSLNLEPVVLNQGFTAQVSFALLGDHASYFLLTVEGSAVKINLRDAIPEDSIPTNRIILLELRASAPQTVPAFTTIVLAVEREETLPAEQLSFAETYYTGRYTEQDGLNFQQLFSLARGYDESVSFALEGDSSAWFGLETRFENQVALTLTSPIPPAVLTNNQKLIFIITATRPDSETARATVVIALPEGSEPNTNVNFDKVLYNGFITLGTVRHENIILSGYNGSRIELQGQHAELFEANLSETYVLVTLRTSTVSPNVNKFALELHAGGARAVLVLEIVESETPVLPTVIFDSPLYVLRVDITYTGLVGRVRATSDNGERISYSLLMNNGNLIERLSVNNDGELWLSAPAGSGAHFLQVVATTAITRATANATVHLTVEAVTVCGDNIVMPPLIILDRDEEEPHRDLVVLNETTYEGCLFSMSNIWPENQSWLYVDNYGLHARTIDREHQSIAFMALSQIQVELVLSCESDITRKTKRSLSSYSEADWLGPYDYGSNKWILTDSIPYNARRTLVNLIVNDINDNSPIFVGKENEPIAVGYPVPDLEEIILPRSLIELKATDADIGENAAIVYWSSEESLAVSPTTGFVHVRNQFNLENNARLIVQATDRNGTGLSGNLELVVKLLEKDHIAVLTIRDAFLDEEEQILNEISTAVGYEIKPLRTVVIPESEQARNRRDTSEGLGATLQIFVYGLMEREPVEVNQLIADIANSNIVTVNVARSVSLEDHLEGNEICVLPGRDTGLLVATIVLSILLFILIVAIAFWIIKRKISRNYERFSDKNSLTSQDATLENNKTEIPKPRLNIEELRRSERRLQERLEVPIVNVSDEAADENPLEAIINISAPEPNLPIVISTIDKLKDNMEESEDDDEFGERKKSRRKSVVTFNENVEKIIHLEDTSDISPESDYEIYKL